MMVKIIESKKLEIYLIAITIVAIGINFLNIPFRQAPLSIAFLVLFTLYLLRMVVSFRHWRFSKGISIINAFLNVQIMICFEAIVFAFQGWKGRYIITYEAITGTQLFILIIALFLLIKWKKINRDIYWQYLKANVLKAAAGILICIVLFYAFDMSSHLINYPPTRGFGFSLPAKLF